MVLSIYPAAIDEQGFDVLVDDGWKSSFPALSYATVP